MSSLSIAIVRSAKAAVPMGPVTGSGDSTGHAAHLVVTRSLKSVTWSLCKWVRNTWWS
jgi:hypothetical protein